MSVIDTITSIYANFETPWNMPPQNSDGKDDDTVIRLWLKNALGADLGTFAGYGCGNDGTAKGAYTVPSTHSVPVSFPAGTQISTDPGHYFFTVTIRIDTNGRDTWVFKPSLTVNFQNNAPVTFYPNTRQWQLSETAAIQSDQFLD
jgi:hypothetical protein